jgi:hypothetical protein
MVSAALAVIALSDRPTMATDDTKPLLSFMIVSGPYVLANAAAFDAYEHCNSRAIEGKSFKNRALAAWASYGSTAGPPRVVRIPDSARCGRGRVAWVACDRGAAEAAQLPWTAYS